MYLKRQFNTFMANFVLCFVILNESTLLVNENDEWWVAKHFSDFDQAQLVPTEARPPLNR